MPAYAAAPPGGGGEARHRQEDPAGQQSPAPGLDDDTPPSGVPVVEPPLWREAVRRTPAGEYGEYQPAYRYQPERVVEPSPPPVGEYPAGGREGAADPGPEPGPPAAEGGRAGRFGGGNGGAGRRRRAPEQEPEASTVPPAGLPQRVPAEPDVPVSRDGEAGVAGAGEPLSGRERWTAPELAWIADQLRRDDVPGEALATPLDVDAVVSAVREVDGVRAASVRPDPTGIHTLRLDLADDADAGAVSRLVARVLLERMGLSTTQHVPQPREPVVSAPPAAAPPAAVPPAAAPPATAAPPVDASATAGPPAAAPPAAFAESVGSVLPGSPGPGSPAGQETSPPQHPGTPPQHPGTEYGSAVLPPDFSELAASSELEPGAELSDAPAVESRPLPTAAPGPRVLIEQVQVSTVGLEATVEVQLSAGERGAAAGVARGPTVDTYLVRLAAVATARAVDELLRETDDPAGPSRCFIEHTGLVSFGSTEVAVAVVLLVCGGWVEQLTGSALVDGDPRQAVVRATLSAVNRRLEALLS